MAAPIKATTEQPVLVSPYPSNVVATGAIPPRTPRSYLQGPFTWITDKETGERRVIPTLDARAADRERYELEPYDEMPRGVVPVYPAVPEHRYPSADEFGPAGIRGLEGTKTEEEWRGVAARQDAEMATNGKKPKAASTDSTTRTRRGTRAGRKVKARA